jgi:nitrogen regulatory protein P-II 1
MKLAQVVGFIRHDRLDQVEERLQNMQVKGLSVSQVKGFGEYADFFSHTWMVRHARMEILVGEDRVDEIVKAILETAQTGVSGDGLVAVLPVEKVYRIRTGALAKPGEL